MEFARVRRSRRGAGEREVLRVAAGIEQSDHRNPSLADTEIVARQLVMAPTAERDAIDDVYRSLGDGWPAVGTGLVRSTATKDTVRLLLGLVTTLLPWIIAGASLGDGWPAVGYATAIAVALGGLVALVVWPPLLRQLRVLVGMVRVRDRPGSSAPFSRHDHMSPRSCANIGDRHD